MVYNVRLVGECIDEDNDETKAFDFVFQFQDAEHFEMCEDTGFDSLMDIWNDLLVEKNGNNQWLLKEDIEVSEFLTEDVDPNHVVVD